MNKTFFLSILICLLLVVSACGQGEEPEVEEHTGGGAQPDTDTLNEEEYEIRESEAGTLTILREETELDITETSGEMTLTVNAVQVADFDINEEFTDFFNGLSEATVFTFHIDAENMSEEDLGFYPNQSTITTNTGQQISSNLLLSDDVGGEFFGNVTKSGEVFFLADRIDEKITSIRWIIDGPHDEDYETVGERMDFTIDL
ncbi:hypothetical protein MM300_18720 [Evansella sp. LMS18]|uniref:hypothetical protein n=1 Tax=Evansella sp. LMS18 TaxID=2924033 RepID=UPI0020D04907|nr:hypothetical protein [Evansella sp. LMS18]UTR09896.1 hypothetical protein MM300_18720 [Evansella sp. LMS18]